MELLGLGAVPAVSERKFAPGASSAMHGMTPRVQCLGFWVSVNRLNGLDMYGGPIDEGTELFALWRWILQVSCGAKASPHSLCLE